MIDAALVEEGEEDVEDEEDADAAGSGGGGGGGGEGCNHGGADGSTDGRLHADTLNPLTLAADDIFCLVADCGSSSRQRGLQLRLPWLTSTARPTLAMSTRSRAATCSPPRRCPRAMRRLSPRLAARERSSCGGAAAVQTRCSRGAAEVQPRFSLGAAEV